MFTITTAKPGEAWHKLHPLRRLGDAVPSMGFDHELEMRVRVDHGDPEGPYAIRFFLASSFAEIDKYWEVIDEAELARRQAHAIENGDEYRGNDVIAFRASSPVVKYCAKLEAHFRALMALELFQLPVN